MAVIDRIIMEGQAHYYTRDTENTGVRSPPHQSHGNRKNKTPSTCESIY